ncbi:hypothetical protein BCV70DRAFT_44580 [Testicularia cyperi]|uniref:Uncharacterized protein n=1 Tax=Testicularia cyperi TaxID=1882483 RepID=A0A317XIT1_9BASI|nr:hypothetical protein BCV70DRAFT_44580 [Testicularia cyperi]
MVLNTEIVSAFSVADLVFPGPIETNSDLIDFFDRLMKPRLATSTMGMLVATEVECAVTLLVCGFLLLKKRQMGKLWLFAVRRSTYGSFIVPNTVTVLVGGVAVYLLGWLALVGVIVIYTNQNAYMLDWLWVVPAPWIILDLAAYYSVFSFIVSSSPRSPLRNARMWTSMRQTWFFLPIPSSPWIMNALIVVLGPLFGFGIAASNALSGFRWYWHTKPLAVNLELKLAGIGAQEMSNIVDPQLAFEARLLWLELLKCWRLAEVGLILAGTLATFSWALLLAYGIANQANLILHTYDMYPNRHLRHCVTKRVYSDLAERPASHISTTVSSEMDETCRQQHKSVFGKFIFLITEGRPKASEADQAGNNATAGSSTEVYHNTWKMTVFCLCQASLLVVALPLFIGAVHILTIWTWRSMRINADYGRSVNVLLVYVACISMTSCTYLAFYSTVITLDPLFKAVLGLQFKPPGPATTNLSVRDPAVIELGHHAAKECCLPSPAPSSDSDISNFSRAHMGHRLSQPNPVKHSTSGCGRKQSKRSFSDNAFLVAFPETSLPIAKRLNQLEGSAMITETVIVTDNASSCCPTLLRVEPQARLPIISEGESSTPDVSTSGDSLKSFYHEA